jgi:hypothetical protein
MTDVTVQSGMGLIQYTELNLQLAERMSRTSAHRVRESLSNRVQNLF